MANDGVSVTVSILDREYQIACREDEREALLAAAGMVNDRMQRIRSQGNVIGTDRVAVMTALNMAHELQEMEQTEAACERMRDRVDGLQQQIGSVLGERNGQAGVRET